MSVVATSTDCGRIAFGGHFAVGEACSPGQVTTMRAAQDEDAVVAMLVDDVGVRQKTWCYLHGGRAQLVANYRDRWQCAASSCLRSYLPLPQDVPGLIDTEQYERIIAELRRLSPASLEYLQRVELDELLTADPIAYKELSITLKEAVLPDIVAHRVRDYGIAASVMPYINGQAVRRGCVTVFSEQKLINLVTKRTRSRNRDQRESWRRMRELCFVDPETRTVMLSIEQVVSSRGSPLCRGIMLALYQEVARAGFREIVEHYIENARPSLEVAHNLYDVIGRRYPNERDWQLAFRTFYYRRDGEAVTEALA